MEYFSDSYAIIALAEGSLSYSKFQGIKIATSVLNIGEIYQIILRKHGKDIADNWFKNVNFELLEITPEAIVDAVYFRFVHKKKDLSLVDAVGYILSLNHKLRFLTGDRQFENMPNVEFVK